tara:strand:+ start:465 stop:902 length:438 start_codon:yes stop_codon:yes gene_type:complete
MSKGFNINQNEKEKILAVMGRRGLKSKEMADILEISPATFCRYINGNSPVGFNFVQALHGHLGNPDSLTFLLNYQQSLSTDRLIDLPKEKTYPTSNMVESNSESEHWNSLYEGKEGQVREIYNGSSPVIKGHILEGLERILDKYL